MYEANFLLSALKVLRQGAILVVDVQRDTLALEKQQRTRAFTAGLSTLLTCIEQIEDFCYNDGQERLNNYM
jgi:hypothetical protein